MINFDDIMARLCKAEDILRTTGLLEDEKTKALLFETVADMLVETSKLLRPLQETEVVDDE